MARSECPLRIAIRCSADDLRDRDHFAASPCHQAGEDANVDVGFQKMPRAIREDRVGSDGMKTIDLLFIGAVDGTRSRFSRTVAARALAESQRPANPNATECVDFRNWPVSAPQFGPTGAFGDQYRL